MEEITVLLPYEEMLKAGMHFGRKKTVFNPKMGSYVFTVRDGICIIDLLKTQEQLNETIKFLKGIKEHNGIVLFVGLTKQAVGGIKALAEATGMPYVLDRWLGGTLTNYKIISARVKRLEEMEREQKSGQLDRYTKKERLMFERELAKMKVRFEGLKKLTRMPDAIFVSSLKEGALPINEARITGVKIFAIANTDADPAKVDHIVPANDRSKRSVDLLLETLKEQLTTQ